MGKHGKSSKVSCFVEELVGRLLPTTTSCCLHVHGSEAKAPMWNIFEWTNDEWSSDECAAFWNGRIESSPRKVLSTLATVAERQTSKGHQISRFPPLLFVFPDAEQSLGMLQPLSILTACTSGSMSITVFTDMQYSDVLCDSLPLDLLIFLNAIH